MHTFSIRLPGTGQTAPMFCFDTGPTAPRQLMNLPLLGRQTGNSATHTRQLLEQWSAPGPVQAFADGPIHGVQTPEYQLLSLNIELTGQGIRLVTQQLYTSLLSRLSTSQYPQLLRCWNYVPDINSGAGDAENYRQFCWGRADAFSTQQMALPAATAIGSCDNWLRVSILSTSANTRVQHLENPRQISAYDYPREYGPRSPSFARATLLQRADTSLLLLSGTSSIVRHETQHHGNLAAQVAETKENIDHLLANSHPSAGDLKPIAMRFYLRDPRLFHEAQQAYTRSFGGFPAAHFLAADICRSDLSMEVEGVFADV